MKENVTHKQPIQQDYHSVRGENIKKSKTKCFLFPLRISGIYIIFILNEAKILPITRETLKN